MEKSWLAKFYQIVPQTCVYIHIECKDILILNINGKPHDKNYHLPLADLHFLVQKTTSKRGFVYVGRRYSIHQL